MFCGSPRNTFTGITLWTSLKFHQTSKSIQHFTCVTKIKGIFPSSQALCSLCQRVVPLKFVWKLNWEYLCWLLQHVVVRRYTSISVFGFLTFRQRVVWRHSYRKLLCGRHPAAPILKSLAPEVRAPFSPTAAPELWLTLHTKWRLCVTNWFQLAVAMVSTLEGAVRGRRGCRVCHMTTRRKCLMSCDVFGRAIKAQWCNSKVQQRGD